MPAKEMNEYELKQLELISLQIENEKTKKAQDDKAKAEAEMEKAMQIAQRIQSKAALDKQTREEIEGQKWCIHLQKSGRSAVVACRNSSHEELANCQHCGKTWIGSELPLHLRPSPEDIGGPIPGGYAF